MDTETRYSEDWSDAFKWYATPVIAISLVGFAIFVLIVAPARHTRAITVSGVNQAEVVGRWDN